MISSLFTSFGTSDVISLSIIFTIIYVTRYYYRYYTRQNPLPGPFPLPIVGNAHQSAMMKFNDWMISLHKKYGDIFEINLAGQRTVVVCSTDLIEGMNVPSTKTKYPYRVVITEAFKEYGILNTGILNNIDQQSWKYNRQFFTQAIITSSLSQQTNEWTRELFEEMENYWKNLETDDNVYDFCKWINSFANEIMYKITTGLKSYSLSYLYYSIIPEEDNHLSEKEKQLIEESEKFIQALEIMLRGISLFYTFNKFMRDYFPIIRGKTIALLKNRDHCFEKLYEIINNRRAEIENSPLDEPLRHDMLTTYITANTPRSENKVKYTDTDLLRPMTDKEIFGNVLDAMGAGVEPLANVLCYVVYHLGQFPEIRKRFQQELDTVLGKDLKKPILNKDLEELRYCEAVIKEVYRYHPFAFFVFRANTEKDMLRGYVWPEKTQFMMLHSALMCRKEYWTDPENFDPDRFYKMDEDDKYMLERKHAKYAFGMFGGGIRVCAGRKLAMVELKCFLASLYRKYDVELVDKNAPCNTTSGLMTYCKELLVKVKPREI